MPAGSRHTRYQARAGSAGRRSIPIGIRTGIGVIISNGRPGVIVGFVIKIYGERCARNSSIVWQKTTCVESEERSRKNKLCTFDLLHLRLSNCSISRDSSGIVCSADSRELLVTASSANGNGNSRHQLAL